MPSGGGPTRRSRRRSRRQAAAAASAAGDVNLVGPPRREPPAGAMAEGFQHDRRVIAQMIQAEVQNVLNKARSLMSTDPDVAMQQLKLTLEKVRQTAELDPDVRDQFVDSLQSALREASVRKDEVEQIRQQRLENRAAASERLLAAKKLERNQMTVKELFERFNSLLAERKYRCRGECRDRGGEGDARQSDPVAGARGNADGGQL